MNGHDVSGEARDSHGRWTTGGAGGEATIDPRVVDVGGDKWNQETAERLEKEYAAVRPVMDKLANESAEKGVTVPGGAEAGSWDEVPSDIQESAKEKYIEDNLESETDHAIENWHESGESTADAAHQLAGDGDWLHEQLGDMIKDRDENDEPRIPYSIDDLAKAITLEPADDFSYKPEGWETVDVKFDNSKLENPDNQMSKDQLGLPGIDAPAAHKALTPKMRDEIADWIKGNFKDEAEKKSSDMTPPEYLSDSAKESLDTMWDEMDEEAKFDYTKNKTSLLDGDSSSEEVEVGKVHMPETWDPMNETAGEDYRNTQRMAKLLATERADQLLKDRGLSALSKGDVQTLDGHALQLKDGKWEVTKGNPETPVLQDDILAANHRLWDGWKGSSVGEDGRLIQVAAHEELGGRLNTSSHGVSVEAAQEYANSNYKAIGGYDGVKALIRGTWETTQYMLDRADAPIVGLYRGMTLANLKAEHDSTTGKVSGFTDDKTGTPISHEDVTGEYGPYTRLPGISIARNGAASWTTAASVANDWKRGQPGKVTLRSEVPRTSVLSVPAYGINVHSEREVVVMGTSVRGWEVFYGTAPRIEFVAMKPHVTKATKHKIDKAEKEHVA